MYKKEKRSNFAAVHSWIKSSLYSWSSIRGCFAELDGMMLKIQLFIVAPAKKLWPWQNSEGGFGLDLVWLSAENNDLRKISSRIDMVPLLLIDLLLKVSDIMLLGSEGSWFAQTKLCTFLWPLSCITKFPGTPVSSRQETDILQMEWFIFLFWTTKWAVFAAVDMNFPISFLPGGEHLYHVVLPHQVWWLTAR